MGTHHNHTPQPGQHQFPKNFIVSSGKTLLVSVGPLAGRRETWGGAGLRPLQKSKAFIKKAINWYQKKTQGGLQEEAEREAGRGTNAVEDRRGGAVQGSWDADTKCISGPPPTPQRRTGRGCGRGGSAVSPPGTPQGRALPETARWEGPATEGREEVGWGQGGRGDISPPCPGAPLRGPA